MIAECVVLATWSIPIGYYYYKYLNKKYTKVNLDEYTLLAGYNSHGKITIDMRSTPHLLITGLSGQGKSRCIKAMLLNLQDKADIVLCNAFAEDYVKVKARKIYGENNILNFISLLLENIKKREKPLYIVIEELGTIKNKSLIAKIQELLCIARHYNIYIIGVIQIATKEELKFKSYFNARLTFRQLDDASYRVVLGTGIGEKILNKREFALVSDDLYFGKTYIIN